MFSSRLPVGVPSNAIAQLVATRRSAGIDLVDLTETNPTLVGLTYPPDILQPLADLRGRTYTPEPLGLASAREAIAAECSRTGSATDASRIVLTTSTSESYALLFKLLCNPGDSVLVPQPSYPLFESLAGLEGVTAVPYQLDYHGVWTINRHSLEQALHPRTRAVLVVTPNNPTGSFLRIDDREWLAQLCAVRGIAVISDEVFADYALRPVSEAATFAGDSPALTFVLGGLSKSAGLPQVKLGWMSVGGSPDRAAAALAQLEIICDTYLSVSTPVQVAAPALIAAGRDIRVAIQERISGNLSALEHLISPHSPVSLLTPEGGWSAVMRVPATMPEEALVLRLIRDAGVIVHPGFFFDFPAEAFIVVSLLPEPETFAPSMQRVLQIVEHEGVQ